MRSASVGSSVWHSDRSHMSLQHKHHYLYIASSHQLLVTVINCLWQLGFSVKVINIMVRVKLTSHQRDKVEINSKYKQDVTVYCIPSVEQNLEHIWDNRQVSHSKRNVNSSLQKAPQNHIISCVGFSALEATHNMFIVAFALSFYRLFFKLIQKNNTNNNNNNDNIFCCLQPLCEWGHKHGTANPVMQWTFIVLMNDHFPAEAGLTTS